MKQISPQDLHFFQLGRQHIRSFLERVATRYDSEHVSILEIGPQDHFSTKDCFLKAKISTFDIVSTHDPDIIGDITKKNISIPDNDFDIVVCMDVLEHTLDPFGAIEEIYRILSPDGLLLVSAPLNFRIHGPIPDCWRFTENGFRVLLKNFEIIDLDILETPDRWLFPIHYNILAKKGEVMPASEIIFKKIK
jgi:SAM-dependent methyltransferase